MKRTEPFMCAAVCGHCESETSLSVQGPDGLYCDMNCYRARRREFFTPLLEMMTRAKDTQPELEDYLTKMVKEGKGAMTTSAALKYYRDQMNSAEKLKCDLETAEIPTHFWSSQQTLGEQLLFLKKEKQNRRLRRKTIQYILERNSKMYKLFKTKLMEEWVELLDMADQDLDAQKIASEMTKFHRILESCEIAFF